MSKKNKTKSCINCGHNPNEDRAWSHPNGPFVTKDEEGWNREWIHARALRFFLHKIEKGEGEGKWIVVDRDYDLRYGKAYVHKKSCVTAFVREHRGHNEDMEMDTGISWKWGA